MKPAQQAAPQWYPDTDYTTRVKKKMFNGVTFVFLSEKYKQIWNPKFQDRANKSCFKMCIVTYRKHNKSR